MLAIVLGLLAGCGRKARDPALDAIDEIVEAIQDRDSARVAARLSESFRGDEGLGRADAMATLRRYFAAYETIRVELHDVRVDRASDARVHCLVAFSGEASALLRLDGLLPPRALYRFEVELRDEKGVWRVSSASWRPVRGEE